tara:strand:+ start:2304 stop:3326 length:1023 start_codon:yes stop_codon:yes gene_type:complete
MADSRLTDLPNLTNPSKEDVLYIVDVTKDSSNQITYGNLVTNTIGSLSAYLEAINIPNIFNIITDVATINTQLPFFALQTSLNSTNTNVNTVSSSVLTYSGFITQNTLDITALSGYIDGKASLVSFNDLNTEVDELSATVLTHATQAAVNDKANQTDLDISNTKINTISGDVLGIDTQLVGINTQADNTDTNVLANQGSILDNRLDIITLSAGTEARALSSELVALSAAFIDSQIEPVNCIKTFPFNISIATNTAYLTSYHGLTNDAGSYEIINNGTTIVVSNLSSTDITNGNGLNWNGLLANSYVLSSGAIEVSIFNPTASTIATTDTDIVFSVTDIAN